MGQKVAVYRKGHFNAAHRLFNPKWSDTKNDAVFGSCNNPNWHGHNYEIVVKVIGEVNSETGFVIDLKELKNLIKVEVEDRYDHKNLNEDCEDFKSLIPTAENICIVCYNRLRKRLDDKLKLVVRLYETPRNFVEYPVF